MHTKLSQPQLQSAWKVKQVPYLTKTSLFQFKENYVKKIVCYICSSSLAFHIARMNLNRPIQMSLLLKVFEKGNPFNFHINVTF